MRRLLLVLGALGVVLGLACAVAVHGLPTSLLGDVSSSAGPAVTVHFDWLPSLLTLPALGLVGGLALGALLGRRGWRLTRA